MAEVDWEGGEIGQGPERDLVRWTLETREARDEPISLWLQPRVRQDILQMAIPNSSVPPDLVEKVAALQPDVELASHQEHMKALAPEEERKIVERVRSNKRATGRHIKNILAKGQWPMLWQRCTA